MTNSNHQQSNTPRYPDIKLSLSEEAGDAFAIVRRAKGLMREHQISASEIDLFLSEAIASDYDHLLQTCMRWFHCFSEPIKEDLFETIARECLDIPTLRARNSDALDFYDCAVWSIHNALVQAYEAGQKSR